MTYIEFYGKTHVENICACLTDVPERVILIGDKLKEMEFHKVHYERVFRDRGCDIEFLCKVVSRSNLDWAVQTLSDIVETYGDCVFDITGGDELLMLALGIVYEKNPGKNIQIHRFNLRNNAVYDCDKDGVTIFREIPALSVEENIRIYGGDVAYGDIFDGKTYLWDMSEEFKEDIRRIWDVCRGDVRLWNAQIGVLETAEKLGTVSGDGLTVTVDIPHLKNYLSRHKLNFVFVRGIIHALYKKDLITAYENDDTTLTITYKDLQVKKCLTKAGQALEMKIFLTAGELTDKEGEPVYGDARNGVVIDWDGEFRDGYDTENEIDILLMRGIIPVFISCKNGGFTVDELYKLNTVAERFGGKYARKVLVTTSLGTNDQAGYLRQRASDMGITVIDDIQSMDDTVLSRRLKNL